jgi:hypothetical protein
VPQHVGRRRFDEGLGHAGEHQQVHVLRVEMRIGESPPRGVQGDIGAVLVGPAPVARDAARLGQFVARLVEQLVQFGLGQIADAGALEQFQHVVVGDQPLGHIHP